MNANIPPLKVWVKLGDKIEHGYAFAVQSYRGRALQFHVLLMILWFGFGIDICRVKKNYCLEAHD